MWVRVPPAQMEKKMFDIICKITSIGILLLVPVAIWGVIKDHRQFVKKIKKMKGQ